MKNTDTLKSNFLKSLVFAGFIAIASTSSAGTAKSLVDDFGDEQNNSLGIPRQFLDDTTAGGSTATNYSVSEGVFTAKGEIAPPRGQPGWASSILLLDPQGMPKDVSEFEGVKLLIRIQKGNISLSANSMDVTNFDYHSAQVITKADGKFHEVKIPFSSMKRMWSEQTKLNTKNISSLSLVAFDLQKGSFNYAVDEISFY